MPNRKFNYYIYYNIRSQEELSLLLDRKYGKPDFLITTLTKD